jgi:hypothetical protein
MTRQNGHPLRWPFALNYTPNTREVAMAEVSEGYGPLTAREVDEIRNAIAGARQLREMEKQTMTGLGIAAARCRAGLGDHYLPVLLAAAAQFAGSGFDADVTAPGTDPTRVSVTIRKDDSPRDSRESSLGSLVFRCTASNHVEVEMQVRGSPLHTEKSGEVAPANAGAVVMKFVKNVMERYASDLRP